MHSKRTMLMALAVLVLVLPFGTGIAAADSGNNANHANHANHGSKQLSLLLSGGVTNAGTQVYKLGGGQLVMGSILNDPINASTASLEYSMFSVVSGTNVWGFSHLELNAQDYYGNPVSVEAWTYINESMSIGIPYGCSPCTSEIPEFFLGGSFITATIGGNTQTLELPVAIESAYLNPWGGPIVISSMDSQTDPALFLVTTYNVGKIDWYGVQMAGYAGGTFGKTQQSGSFSMNVNSRENLVTGVEYDRGTIALNGIGPDGYLGGSFRGISVVPTAGEFACSGMQLPPGTCTMTGLNSSGTMTLHGGHYEITGKYVTVWGIPAIGFNSTVSATATPIHHHTRN